MKFGIGEFATTGLARVRICTAVLFVFFSCTDAGLADVAIQRNTITKGVRLPLIGREKGRPVALATIETLRLGAGRSGVFRIGASPVVICENVKIAFKANDPKALANFPSTMAALAKVSTMELRNLSIFAPNAATPILTAARAELEDGTPWKLRNVTLADGSTADFAELATSGAKLGILTYEKHGKRFNIALLAP